MAAVIQLFPVPSESDVAQPAKHSPELRVIHGGRSTAVRARQRMYFRRRVLAAVVLVTVAVALVVGGRVVVAEWFSNPGGSVSASAESYGSTHQVRSGDTLWAIASAIAPQDDTRRVVDEIISMNPDLAAELRSGGLRPGQSLRLPVSG